MISRLEPARQAAAAAAQERARQRDSGAAALSRVLRFLQVPANPDQLIHQHGRAGQPMNAIELVRAARAAGARSKLVRPRAKRLQTMPLPALAGLKDGGWFILVMAAPDRVLVQQTFAPRPEPLDMSRFEEIWDGRLILLSRRNDEAATERPFGFSWFLSVIGKYRSLFT